MGRKNKYEKGNQPRNQQAEGSAAGSASSQDQSAGPSGSGTRSSAGDSRHPEQGSGQRKEKKEWGAREPRQSRDDPQSGQRPQSHQGPQPISPEKKKWREQPAQQAWGGPQPDQSSKQQPQRQHQSQAERGPQQQRQHQSQAERGPQQQRQHHSQYGGSQSGQGPWQERQSGQGQQQERQPQGPQPRQPQEKTAWGQKPAQQGWGGSQPGQGPRQERQPQGSQTRQPQEKTAWGQQPAQQGWGGPQPGQSSKQQPQRQHQSQAGALLSKSPSVTSLTSQGSQKSAQLQKSSRAAPVMSYRASDVSLARGKVGKKITVETNYLDLDISRLKDVAYHYDVKIEPERPKKFLRLAFDTFQREKLNKIQLAYDGQASCYSSQPLPEDVLADNSIVLTDPVSGRQIKYKVTLKKTESWMVELSSLKSYSKDRVFDKPMRAIQCLDVVLSTPCHEKGIRGGRSFYRKPDEKIDLADGYELWLGLFQSAQLGDTPLLNVDVSHKAFPSEFNCLELVQYFGGNLNRELDYRTMRKVDSFMKSLNCVYKPPSCFGTTPKAYKYNSLRDSAERLRFKTEDGKEMTVAAYFENRGYRLKYPKMPCLHLGSTVRSNFMPLEFCSIPTGQATLKSCTDVQVRNMIRYAATSTDERKMKIMELYKYFNHNVHPIVREFGLQIGRDFLRVDARILDAPKLEYSGSGLFPKLGSWRIENQSFLHPAQVVKKINTIRWSILIAGPGILESEVRNFAGLMTQTAKKLKVNLDENFTVRIQNDNRRWQAELDKFKTDGNDFVLVVIPYANDAYWRVKQSAELRIGLLTQCVKADTIKKRGNVQTVQNILLKVNAKLGGTNHRISDQYKTNILKDRIMFIGADVTHPSPGQAVIPSVVGVAASHDAHGTQYNFQYRLQDPRKEVIEHFDEIVTCHLKIYQQYNNKQLPNKIIYYRDGVADGQFPQVDQFEIQQMRNACSSAMFGQNYRPTITCIVVQKRHHTRFFPGKIRNVANGIGKFNNVQPGTVVDTTITHPNESQFFLVSHESIQGTAKPTKYCVIRDESKLNIDELQTLTYNLCHLFPRCNRAVSYPTPAYLAHLVAARGRVYIEGDRLDLDNLKREYEKRQIRDDLLKVSPMFAT